MVVEGQHDGTNGLPLAEALAAGTPVIASDLPALREIGGQVPEYLSINDADAWQSAIDAYAQDPAPRRQSKNAFEGLYGRD